MDATGSHALRGIKRYATTDTNRGPAFRSKECVLLKLSQPDRPQLRSGQGRGRPTTPIMCPAQLPSEGPARPQGRRRSEAAMPTCVVGVECMADRSSRQELRGIEANAYLAGKHSDEMTPAPRSNGSLCARTMWETRSCYCCAGECNAVQLHNGRSPTDALDSPLGRLTSDALEQPRQHRATGRARIPARLVHRLAINALIPDSAHAAMTASGGSPEAIAICSLTHRLAHMEEWQLHNAPQRAATPVPAMVPLGTPSGNGVADEDLPVDARPPTAKPTTSREDGTTNRISTRTEDASLGQRYGRDVPHVPTECGAYPPMCGLGPRACHSEPAARARPRSAWALPQGLRSLPP